MGKISDNHIYLTSFQVLTDRFITFLLDLLHNPELHKHETINHLSLYFSVDAGGLPA